MDTETLRKKLVEMHNSGYSLSRMCKELHAGKERILYNRKVLGLTRKEPEEEHNIMDILKDPVNRALAMPWKTHA